MARLDAFERHLLTRMLTSHAYREKLAAERFSDALRLLPLYESEEYWRNVIEEEEEHYRGCLAVAKEVGIDLAPLVDSRLLMAPEGIPAFHTWLDVLLAHAFNDKAGYYVLIGLKGSKVGPYARLAEDILVEEDAHGIAGASALVNFYASQIESEERGQALLKHLDAAVWCLGRPGTRGDADAVRLGLKTRSSSDTLREFCSYVDAMLVKLDRHDLIPIIKRYQQ